jgi:hypothetical protein
MLWRNPASHCSDIGRGLDKWKKGGKEVRNIRGLKERKKEVILLDIFDGSYSNGTIIGRKF